MKVQLFIPKAPIGYNPNCGIYFPLSLLRIASYVKYHLPQVDVSIWDGELYETNEDLYKELDPEATVVAISCTSFNYQYALDLAQRANQNGSLVVLGGIHVSWYQGVVLSNRSYVDIVVVGKGEQVMVDLLREVEKNGSQSISRKVLLGDSSLSIEDLPDMDYSLVRLDEYWRRHQRVFPDFASNSISVITHEGCGKREQTGPCSFCSIRQPFQFIHPKVFWQRMQQAVQQYGFNFIKDWGDSINAVSGLLPALVATRPSELSHMQFSVFDNLAGIDQTTIDYFKQLNVRCLFAGVESANDDILRKMNKKASVAQMREALQLIGKNDIPVFISFVLGERGETVKTLEQTLSFARQVSQQVELRISNGSPMAILPGSPNFHRLAKRYPWLYKQDLFDLVELKKMWVQEFCPDLRNYYILEEYASLIGEFGELDFRFGWD